MVLWAGVSLYTTICNVMQLAANTEDQFNMSFRIFRFCSLLWKGDIPDKPYICWSLRMLFDFPKYFDVSPQSWWNNSMVN